MNEPKLVRGISRFDLTLITINSIIGAGIFGLPSRVAALIGTQSLLAFVACAVFVGLIVLCFAEVSSRFAATGGAYLYARAAFGEFVGFEIGWLFWLARLTAFATNCNLLVGYLGFFSPVFNQALPRVAVILAAVSILAWINFVGIRESATLINVLTVGKLLPMFAFAIVGAFFVDYAGLFSNQILPEFLFAETATVRGESLNHFSNAVLLLVYAFTGFEMAVVPAGEMKNPQKSAPFALLTAIATVAALYILIQLVCLGTLPELATSERPLADSANKFMGAFGAGFITIGAIISIFGNLNSLMLSASRVPFAMAEQNDLPPIFASTSAKFKTPIVSLVLTAVVILILTVQTSFLAALTISTITRLLVYVSTCAALPVLRWRKDAPEAKFQAPLGIFAAALSLLLIAWLLSNVKLAEIINLVVVAVAGIILYFAFCAFGKNDLKQRSDN